MTRIDCFNIFAALWVVFIVSFYVSEGFTQRPTKRWRVLHLPIGMFIAVWLVLPTFIKLMSK